jgi:hypothetical protein
MNGKIIRKGTYYVAIGPNNVHVEGEFKLKQDAIKALVSHNESVQQKKIHAIANQFEIKLEATRNKLEKLAKEQKEAKKQSKAKSPKKKSTKRKTKAKSK